MLDYQALAIEFQQKLTLYAQEIGYIFPCIRTAIKRYDAMTRPAAVRTDLGILQLPAIITAPGSPRTTSRTDLWPTKFSEYSATNLTKDPVAFDDSAILEAYQLLVGLQIDQN